ncbi:ribonuclease P protein component [Rathayibacter sp. CAU 1779]
MLAKANRIRSGADYRLTVRKGVRVHAAHTITYVRRASDLTTVRFGFIVSKAVGVAVVRNTVRRRLKAVSRELLPDIAPGYEIVVRALPASAQASWTTLQGEIRRAVDKVGARCMP